MHTIFLVAVRNRLVSTASVLGLVVLAIALISGAKAHAQEGNLLRVTLLGGEVINFDRAALDALPQESFATSTIWTEGLKKFGGPSLRAVLGAAGIESGTLKLIAVNDYAVTMDAKDALATVPIIATRIDEEPFSRRDKGPLWLVYPYDLSPIYRTEVMFSRSIWQLVEIKVSAP